MSYKTVEIAREWPERGEIEFTIRPKDMPWIRERYRITTQNGDTIAVARPAKGSFRRGYDWLLTFPLYGTGKAGIKRALEGRRTGGNPYGRDYAFVAAWLYKLTLKLRKTEAR